MESQPTYTAFAEDRLVVSGDLETMLLAAKEHLDRGDLAQPILIFEDASGQQVDFDFRGTLEDVLARLPTHPLFAGRETTAKRSGPGRPRLGVVSREVSLLPRHWTWLEQQPNGISAALRRLVDQAKKREPDREQARVAREAAGRFMTVMAGDRPGFEEASRALYARERDRLDERIRDWPPDIRGHLGHLLDVAERLEVGSVYSEAGIR